MASDEPDRGSEGQPITAAALREAIAKQKAAKLDEANKKSAEAGRALEAFFAEFMATQVTQQALDAVRRKVLIATERGEFEIEVFRFPAKWCTDRGRAINNGAPGWPDTLQGKARNFYDLFVERGRPQGFKLKAQILEFPGGLPGDVGLILSWK